MTPEQVGNIREDIGSLKASVKALTEGVRALGESSSAGRARIYEKLEVMDRKLDRAEASIDGLNERVDGMEPTIEEYRTRMAQVRAAGWLGRALWVAGGFLLAAAASLVSGWEWLSRLIRPPPA